MVVLQLVTHEIVDKIPRILSLCRIALKEMPGEPGDYVIGHLLADLTTMTLCSNTMAHDFTIGGMKWGMHQINKIYVIKLEKEYSIQLFAF